MAWTSMDAAPQDGTEVLLRVRRPNTAAGLPGGYHVVGHFIAGGHCIEDHPPVKRGWYFWNGRMFDLAAEPIEWHPLPT